MNSSCVPLQFNESQFRHVIWVWIRVVVVLLSFIHRVACVRFQLDSFGINYVWKKGAAGMAQPSPDLERWSLW